MAIGNNGAQGARNDTNRHWREPAACSGYTPEAAAEMGLLKKEPPEDFTPPAHGAEAEPQTQTNTQTIQYNPELPALLGLADGATDEEVLTAVRALKEGADAAAEAEAEALVNSEEAKEGVELSEEEKKECREEVVTNRARGLKYLRLLVNSKRPTATPAPRRYADNSTPAARAALANRTPQKDSRSLSLRYPPDLPETADRVL